MALTEKRLAQILQKNNSCPEQVVTKSKKQQKQRSKELKGLYSDLVNNMVSYKQPGSAVSLVFSGKNSPI
jgi:hypothetical protein